MILDEATQKALWSAFDYKRGRGDGAYFGQDFSGIVLHIQQITKESSASIITKLGKYFEANTGFYDIDSAYKTSESVDGDVYASIQVQRLLFEKEEENNE